MRDETFAVADANHRSVNERLRLDDSKKSCLRVQGGLAVTLPLDELATESAYRLVLRTLFNLVRVCSDATYSHRLRGARYILRSAFSLVCTVVSALAGLSFSSLVGCPERPHNDGENQE